jgi:hypothetical protein
MSKRQIRVVGPHDKFKPNEKQVLYNVTSGSKTWTRCFSPFFLGPVKLYGAYGAWNVENAWQYSKVYPCHADKDGNPTPRYFEWAMEGWANERAVRYPMGKGNKPLHSWWNGKKLKYIDARKEIYMPLYRQAVMASGEFERLVYEVSHQWRQGNEVVFWDFDGFDHIKLGLSLDEVLNQSARKMGHAFVLAMMVEEALQNEA